MVSYGQSGLALFHNGHDEHETMHNRRWWRILGSCNITVELLFFFVIFWFCTLVSPSSYRLQDTQRNIEIHMLLQRSLLEQ